MIVWQVTKVVDRPEDKMQLSRSYALGFKPLKLYDSVNAVISLPSTQDFWRSL